jgi:transcriptional regulator with XRE-family HTH domain
MYAATLKAYATLKGMNQSAIAAAAGVSRQRVSQWFKETPPNAVINVRMANALKLAAALSIDVGELSKPFPLVVEEKRLRSESTRLLWDKLYPDIVSLFAAALDGRRDALARVTQVFGLHEAAALFGSRVWRDFPRYKSFIKPARRAGLEHLWQYQQSQTSA